MRATLLRRAVVGLSLLAVAFALDPWAYRVLRAVLLYDAWGEMREGLTAAKFLGSGLGTAVVALAVGLVDRTRWRRGLVVLLVAGAAGTAAGGLKVMTGRERPSHLDQAPGAERRAFSGPAAGLDARFQSFPSGHTAGAFATATCLAAFYPPARAVCYGVAAAAGANRVVKHQHFLSDVVAGALLGHLVALALLSAPGLGRWSVSASEERRVPAPDDRAETVDAPRPSSGSVDRHRDPP